MAQIFRIVLLVQYEVTVDGCKNYEMVMIAVLAIVNKQHTCTHGQGILVGNGRHDCLITLFPKKFGEDPSLVPK